VPIVSAIIHGRARTCGNNTMVPRRSMMRTPILLSVAVLCLACSPSMAALTAYMTITGRDQGQILGSVTQLQPWKARSPSMVLPMPTAHCLIRRPAWLWGNRTIHPDRRQGVRPRHQRPDAGVMNRETARSDNLLRASHWRGTRRTVLHDHPSERTDLRHPPGDVQQQEPRHDAVPRHGTDWLHLRTHHSVVDSQP